MADGESVVVLRTVPCEPKDFNTARCRIAPKVMKLIGAIIGSPITVKLKSSFVLCTAWPRDDGIEDVVQFDAFITQSAISDEDKLATKKSPSHGKLKAPDDFCVLQPVEAKAVVVSVHVSGNEHDLYQGFSLPKALQEVRNERKIHALLRNHTIATGCCIRPRKSRNNPNRLLKGIEKIVVESTETVSSPDEEPETLPSPGEGQRAVYVRVTDRTKIVARSIKQYSDERDYSCFVLAGVETAAQSLKELIHYPFLYSDSFSRLGLDCPKGILLQGAPGVGKTLLVKTVTSQCGSQLITLNGTDVFGPHPGESEENLRNAFEKARTASKHGPCVLFIDEIDALCPKRGSSAGGQEENRIVTQLLALMDGLNSRGRLVVIGATNRPNVIDPALRRPGRFDREIVIGVPTVTQRLAILGAHTKTIPLAQDVDLAHLAEISLGYVGADLASLCREATFIALKRNAEKAVAREAEAQETLASNRDGSICMSDFELAMCHIVPSTYRGLEGIVDVQPVRWEDIGGLAEVKLALQQAIEWPVKYPEAFARLGLARPRGVLLYGPPGCCKTTLVRAAASSCHVTFLSLSCAQLFSPYVGDAERRIRELFVKARSTAPSILFLDELDVIAAKRSDTACSGVEARLLSTLLNEMDGIGVSANIYESKREEKNESTRRTKKSMEKNENATGKNHEDYKQPDLGGNYFNDEKHCALEEQGSRFTTFRNDTPNKRVSEDKTGTSRSTERGSRTVRNLATKDVLIVAATNRPGAIDEAFIRPGRIDRVIYIPPPDTETRLEILKVYCGRCPVADDVDLRSLAEKTEMFSGADLENLCREAALYSLEDQGMSASAIEKKHFVAALAAVRPSLTPSLVDKYKDFK